MSQADTIVILDFETTGLSPTTGDRAIEIGAVKLVDGEVVAQFQQLMNPGMRVSNFIEDYTGISNDMLSDAPDCETVMDEFLDFLGDDNLVAHNASFDQRFLDAEVSRINRRYPGQFACSMLAARRIYQHAPDHKLGTLVQYANLDGDGQFHRALYDAQMTAKVWIAMLDELHTGYGIADVPFKLMQTIARTPKHRVAELLNDFA